MTSCSWSKQTSFGRRKPNQQEHVSPGGRSTRADRSRKKSLMKWFTLIFALCLVSCSKKADVLPDRSAEASRPTERVKPQALPRTYTGTVITDKAPYEWRDGAQ